MKKRIFAALLCAVMAVSALGVLAGCGSTTEPTEPETSEIVSEETTSEATDSEETEEAAVAGGWTYQEADLTAEQSAFFLDACEKAASTDLTPVAVLGTQVVAGTNYLYLASNENGFTLVKLYHDLEGNNTIIEAGSVFNQAEAGDLWEINPLETDIVPKSAEDALNEAIEDLTGAQYHALAMLAFEEVGDTNYLLLCTVTPVVPNAAAELKLVEVKGTGESHTLGEITDL